MPTVKTSRLWERVGGAQKACAAWQCMHEHIHQELWSSCPQLAMWPPQVFIIASPHWPLPWVLAWVRVWGTHNICCTSIRYREKLEATLWDHQYKFTPKPLCSLPPRSEKYSLVSFAFPRKYQHSHGVVAFLAACPSFPTFVEGPLRAAGLSYWRQHAGRCKKRRPLPYTLHSSLLSSSLHMVPLMRPGGPWGTVTRLLLAP